MHGLIPGWQVSGQNNPLKKGSERDLSGYLGHTLNVIPSSIGSVGHLCSIVNRFAQHNHSTTVRLALIPYRHYGTPNWLERLMNGS